MFVFTLASTICEGLMLAMLLPLFETMGFSGTGESSSAITSGVQRVFAALDVPMSSGWVSALMLIVVAVAATIFLAQAFLATRLEALYVARWQSRLFAAVTQAGWPFLRRQRSADLIAALTTEFFRLRIAFYQINLIATLFTFLVVQIAIAAIIAPTVMVAMLLLAVGLFAVTQQMVRRAVGLGGELDRGKCRSSGSRWRDD